MAVGFDTTAWGLRVVELSLEFTLFTGLGFVIICWVFVSRHSTFWDPFLFAAGLLYSLLVFCSYFLELLLRAAIPLRRVLCLNICFAMSSRPSSAYLWSSSPSLSEETWVAPLSSCSTMTSDEPLLVSRDSLNSYAIFKCVVFGVVLGPLSVPSWPRAKDRYGGYLFSPMGSGSTGSREFSSDEM